ncbi:MAG TPA: TIGR03761 family integrating conjugative element protein [Nevskiaceae bacterium]|nr:TIGR03761 family integrating conjugative element protein [Nevskiaceae bacterium]
MTPSAVAPCEVREVAPALPLVPGPLRSGSWIDLQTLQAQRLVRGRKAGGGQSRIVGLAGFGMRLRTIWMASLADDPWADWWLLRVHAALEQADAALDALVAAADTILAKPVGVCLDRAQSVRPLRVPLAFSNPYGYRGAYLLAKFDDTTRAVLTAEHVALLDRCVGRRMIQEAGTHVRRAFLAAEGYQRHGVTRQDVRVGTTAARDARERMGEVPADVLEGRRRAVFAPHRDREPQS